MIEHDSNVGEVGHVLHIQDSRKDVIYVRLSKDYEGREDACWLLSDGSIKNIAWWLL